MNLDELLTVIVVFFSIATIIKLFLSYLLKRRLIKAGHFENAGVLGAHFEGEENANQLDRFPALKWGLIALFGGIGLIIIDSIRVSNPNIITYESVLPYGIFMVSIAVGFLLYFIIANYFNKSGK